MAVLPLAVSRSATPLGSSLIICRTLDEGQAFPYSSHLIAECRISEISDSTLSVFVILKAYFAADSIIPDKRMTFFTLFCHLRFFLRKSKVNYCEFYFNMWTENWLKMLHHLCRFHWKILHFRPNTKHHILCRITTTFRTFLETSFTKCKQTRHHYVRCHPWCLQLSLFLTKQQQFTGSNNLYVNLISRYTNFPLCNNRPTTVYPSNR